MAFSAFFPESPARNRNGILARVLRVREQIAIGLVDGAEIQAVFGTLSTELLDILDVKNQLDGRLAAALTFSSLMKQDIGTAITRDELDDPISGQPGCRKAKMAFVEAGGFLDIPGVDHDPAEWHRYPR